MAELKERFLTTNKYLFYNGMDSKHGHKKRRTNVDAYLNQKQFGGFDKKFAEHEALKRNYKHLKAIHELQNRTVRHFMHNVMSPLSAVSGYLELLSNNLKAAHESEKLQRYSSNIGDGLNEIGFLLEQLHEIYKEVDTSGEGQESPVVELNWLVNEIKNIISNSTEIKASGIVFNESGKPVYVEAELFQIKLMIYNLVTTADKFSTEKSILEIEVDQDESEFALLIRSSEGEITDDSLNDIFKKRDIIKLTDDIDESSSILLGLKICAQVAEQINGHIIMDKRDRKSPQFILTAPLARGNSFY